jgi:putative PEP-CTERM system histidine kinase
MLDAVVFGATTVTSLALAIGALAAKNRGLRHWSFALGMLAFAAESACAFALLTTAETTATREFWLQAVTVGGGLLLVPWAFFAVRLITMPRAGFRWFPAAVTGAAVGAAVAVIGVVAATHAFDVAHVDGAFYAARITAATRFAVLGEVLATVAILVALEFALRSARHDARWAMKHLLLGLGGIFLVRFYLLSQVLLFNVVMAPYVRTAAAAVVIGNVAIAASLIRSRLRADLTVSRQFVYRSVVLTVLGMYLFVVGALGWILNTLQIGEELFFGSILVFVSALGLAAFLFSENVRWRVKRFVSAHMYRTKYDYREQWMRFTTRLGSLVTPEQLGPAVLGAVMDAIGATRGVLYLADESRRRLHVAARIGIDHGLRRAVNLEAVQAYAGDTAMPTVVTGPTGVLDVLFENGETSLFVEGIVVPLAWGGQVIGVLLVGPERAGAPYTAEDVEFVATIARQSAGAIVTARMSESLAQTRELEAFHRLTSFVMHDLKNSIYALTMLTDNALKHFDDPEFQRDAVRTLARTVERMNGLLGRLSGGQKEFTAHKEPVDLASLVLEAALPLVQTDRIGLVKKLTPLPPVQADPEGLLKVIQNLVNNAVQSIAGSGTITLRTADEGGRAVVEVADTGCGMSDEFIQKSLFSPFQTTKKGGWGIGLYQAKGIVEAHGGTIEVSSAEGTGTMFRVSLPLAAGDRG